MARVLRRGAIAALAAVVATSVLPLFPASAAIGPAATITNGTVELGVQPEGNLIVGARGLAYVPTNIESLAPGCDCEGWGVADVGSGLTGYASESNGQANVTVVDFNTTATDATSLTTVAGTPAQPAFNVTHAFTPSALTPFLYKLDVRVQNTSSVAATDLRYRRVMDWDVEPTAFDEFVTNEPGNATTLIHLSNDGFDTPDPLKANTAADNSVSFYREGRVVDYGPNDHGSLWDFSFGPLAAGATKDFTIFYGAAPTEPDALGALAAVGAEAFSLGQANDSNQPALTDTDPAISPRGDIDGAPATFIFAFEGIGGAPVFPPPTLSIGDASQPEGDTGTSPMSFPVTLSAATTNAVTVDYATSPVSATADVDYTTTTGTLTIPANATTATIAVPIIADTANEPDETFTVALSNPVNATLARTPGTGTIVNDDPVPVTAAAPATLPTDTPTGKGYWLFGLDGGVFTFGDADFWGSTGNIVLNRPVVALAATPTGKGYWLVGTDGGVFAFGDARFFGSMAAAPLNKPIVGITSTPTGKGYWLVASDGGIFAFGDALFFGSTGGLRLNQPIVGMASMLGGNGYWLVATDGGVFAFGNARFLGSMGGTRLNKPVLGIMPTATDLGYWLVAGDGGVFAFGNAPFLGSTGATGVSPPAVGLAPTADGDGYWMVLAGGKVLTFGKALFFGDMNGRLLKAPLSGMRREPRPGSPA